MIGDRLGAAPRPQQQLAPLQFDLYPVEAVLRAGQHRRCLGQAGDPRRGVMQRGVRIRLGPQHRADRVAVRPPGLCRDVPRSACLLDRSFGVAHPGVQPSGAPQQGVTGVGIIDQAGIEIGKRRLDEAQRRFGPRRGRGLQGQQPGQHRPLRRIVIPDIRRGEHGAELVDRHVRLTGGDLAVEQVTHRNQGVARCRPSCLTRDIVGFLVQWQCLRWLAQCGQGRRMDSEEPSQFGAPVRVTCPGNGFGGLQRRDFIGAPAVPLVELRQEGIGLADQRIICRKH